jgi:3-deoxy-D-manno-octulosonic-acid transferase
VSEPAPSRPKSARRRLRKRVVQALTLKLGPPLAAAYIRLVERTCRVRILEAELYPGLWRRGPFVLAFWHGRMLAFPQMLWPGQAMDVLISEHRDGELITRTIRHFGIGAVRGSSSHGAKGAVQEMMRRLSEGGNLAITPDGPRGPCEVAAPGAAILASAAGVPVTPVSWVAKPAVHLGSWDRFLLPAPFARIVYAIEPDLTAPPGLGPQEIADLSAELTRRLNRASERAQVAMERADDPLIDPLPATGASWPYRVYDAVLSLGLVLLVPLWLYRWFSSPRVRRRLGERWARYQPLVRAHLFGGPRPVWIHAVSVGEVAAILPLARALASPGPQGEPPHRVVLSTVTVTGNETASAKAPPGTDVLYLPVDLSWVVRRAIRAIRPSLFVSTESEVWPGLLRELERAGVPTAMANGRVSERTARRYRWAFGFLSGALRRVSLFALQSEVFRRRLEGMGAPSERMRVLGNLKFDLEIDPIDSSRRAELVDSLGLAGRTPVIVAGSTHEGEEEAMLAAVEALMRAGRPAGLVLAPRHPERFVAVATLLAARGISFVRSSEHGAGTHDGTAVHLLDTIGQLRQLYGIGDVAFVGGTLAPIGGHNLLEPAAHGLPVVFGPHTESCEEIAAALLEAGAAIRVNSAAELSSVFEELARDEARRQVMGEAGRALISAHRGATARTAAALRGLLASRADGPTSSSR